MREADNRDGASNAPEWNNLPRTDITRTLPGHWTAQFSSDDEEEEEEEDGEPGDFGLYDDLTSKSEPQQYVGSGKGISSYYAQPQLGFLSMAKTQRGKTISVAQSEEASSLESSDFSPSDIGSGVGSAVESGVESAVESGVGSAVESGIGSAVESGVGSVVESGVGSALSSLESSSVLEIPPIDATRNRLYEEPNADGSWVGSNWLTREEGEVGSICTI